jgi:pre-mRNA-processing factor SLU7
MVPSIYAEDVFPLNHTSVWGSFWRDGRWGFACCRSFVRGSYCVGESGRDAEAAVRDRRRGGGAVKGVVSDDTREEIHGL